MSDSLMTNGTLVDTIRTRIAEDLARTGVRPGRRRLAHDLGVTEHAVRQALDTLTADQEAMRRVAPRMGDDSPCDSISGEDAPARATPTPPVRQVGETEPTHVRQIGAVDHASGVAACEITNDPPDVDAADTATHTHPGGLAHPIPRWPLVLIALPAFVAIWGGWVGLGRMAGFGPVEPLPGISTLTFDLAITLPIGVEVYSAYALSVWLGGRVRERVARRFACWSALSSLLVGAAGQVAYHLMEAASMTVAPWWVTAVVATLPVATLGMAAALHHLIAEDSRGMAKRVGEAEDVASSRFTTPEAHSRKSGQR